jgi:hypothetical protein
MPMSKMRSLMDKSDGNSPRGVRPLWIGILGETTEKSPTPDAGRQIPPASSGTSAGYPTSSHLQDGGS